MDNKEFEKIHFDNFIAYFERLVEIFNGYAIKENIPTYSGPINEESVVYLQNEIAKMHQRPAFGIYTIDQLSPGTVRNAFYDAGRQYLAFIKGFRGSARKDNNEIVMSQYIPDFSTIEPTFEDFAKKYFNDVAFKEMYELKLTCALFTGKFELKLAKPGDIIGDRCVEYMMFPGCIVDSFILEPECKFE